MAVITDIEGREWRRRHSSQRGGIPDHPRASTSDDVECMARDAFGQILLSRNSNAASERFALSSINVLMLTYHSITIHRAILDTVKDLCQSLAKSKGDESASFREFHFVSNQLPSPADRQHCLFMEMCGFVHNSITDPWISPHHQLLVYTFLNILMHNT